MFSRRLATPDETSLLNQIEDGLILVDNDGRIVYSNPAFQGMVGCDDRALRGRNCRDIFEAAGCRGIDMRPPRPAGCLGQGRFGLHWRHPDGMSGTYCVTATAFRDDVGRIAGYLESFRRLDRLCDGCCPLTRPREAPGIFSTSGSPPDPGLEPATIPLDRIGNRPEEERLLILTLARNRWNATRTARDIGISRTTLWRRMKRLGLLKSMH